MEGYLNQHNAHDERVSREEYIAIVEKDSEHRYEYLDGDMYMMTGGSPVSFLLAKLTAKVAYIQSNSLRLSGRSRSPGGGDTW
jgi:hypothetical protein